MHRRQIRTTTAALLAACLLAATTAACGTRLTGAALGQARGVGTGSGGGGAPGAADTGAGVGALSSGGPVTAATSGSGDLGGSAGSSGTAARGSGGAAAAQAAAGACAGVTSASDGGATDTGVTASTITLANITSISGVAPGLTQSARDATEAWADYVNSQGGICGRQLKIVPMDDGNDSQQNYADAQQACSSTFAVVGSASGFDDGTASAASSCGIPVLSAENSTEQAGNVATTFGASPGNAHYLGVGPALYLKSKYPQAVTKAAMIYLNVPATVNQAQHMMQAYQSVGFDYVYTASVSPTEPNYAPYVLQMEQKGVQYVTEWSDLSSAARLDQAMQQQGYRPQVVDWNAEMYSPSFVDQTAPASNGDLVLMATAGYEEASGNPGLQLYLSWLNRVAPGAKHDIFGEFAWSAGMAFLQAARAVGPHLTRTALLGQLAQIHDWTGAGVQPSTDYGAKQPSRCFYYVQIEGTSFNRVYPAAPNTYDCSGSLYHFP